VTTGISARDRSETIRRAVFGKRDEIQRPGHVFPLVAVPGGVLVRRGHTEAAVDLARCAGREPVGVIVEIIGDDGEMLRGEALTQFADEHGLVKTSIDALSLYVLQEGSTRGVR
jgi:3,4-dihydroxy-2-butanone 4-phosphate synthase